MFGNKKIKQLEKTIQSLTADRDAAAQHNRSEMSRKDSIIRNLNSRVAAAERKESEALLIARRTDFAKQLMGSRGHITAVEALAEALIMYPEVK